MFSSNKQLPAQGVVKRKNANKNSKNKLDKSSLGLWTADLPISSTAISTTNVGWRLDDFVFGSGGILLSYPQSLAHPYMAGAGSFIAFVGRLKWVKLDVRMNLVGSQSNVLLAGDLFSRVRIIILWTKTPYQSAYTLNGFTIDSQVDRRDGDFIFYDKIINLPTTAYDSANGYNCPGLRTIDLSIPLNRLPICEFFSSNSNTIFDTRAGSFYMYVTSDSSVAPHPTLSGSTRLYYRKA